MVAVALCDDDKRDLNKAAEMLREILEYCKIEYELRIFSSASELLKQVSHVDVGILDIAMKEINGIDLGRKLKEKFPAVKLIYTTCYEQYVMQAINEVHAFSFLVKPLQKDRMKEQLTTLIEEMKRLEDTEEKAFYKVTDENQIEIPVLKLKLNDIIYFEYIKTKRRIAMFTNCGTYEYPYVMERLTEELQDKNFVVNCRGNLVNLKHVVKIKGYDLYMDNGKKLPVSQKRIVELKEKLNDFIHSQM